ncbi:MAG: hypothetical protein KAS32_03110 [Candidatus Peribacteraceae bacterium]|nr:hypothetical protein [Candidatus Peribacteraceae bacterium]
MNKSEVVAETKKHIRAVQMLLQNVRTRLTARGAAHDSSKLSEDELPIFIEFTPKLKGCTYGSEEYKGFLKAMKPALDHHYASNRHHPEHFSDGILDMNLIDIIEMFCDWRAATERHADGDIKKSIQVNQARFGYSDEMKQILLNTVDYMRL